MEVTSGASVAPTQRIKQQSTTWGSWKQRGNSNHDNIYRKRVTTFGKAESLVNRKHSILTIPTWVKQQVRRGDQCNANEKQQSKLENSGSRTICGTSRANVPGASWHQYVNSAGQVQYHHAWWQVSLSKRVHCDTQVGIFLTKQKYCLEGNKLPQFTSNHTVGFTVHQIKKMG